MLKTIKIKKINNSNFLWKISLGLIFDFLLILILILRLHEIICLLYNILIAQRIPYYLWLTLRHL